MSETVLDRLSEALIKAAVGNSQTATPAAAVLWTDNERLWERSLSKLGTSLPQLIALGDFNPESKSGPSVWLIKAFSNRARSS